MTQPLPSEAQVLQALRAVVDPDLHEDIVALGFVHDVVIGDGRVAFEVRLTTPACPAKEMLQQQCREAVSALPGVATVQVRMTAQTRGGLRGVEAGSALAGVKHLVAVASGKGGVGKSTTTVNLAYALRAQGAKVGIVDADVHGPSLQHLTGVGVPTDPTGEGMRPAEVDGIPMVSMAMFVPSRRPTLLRGPRITAVIQQFLTAFAWGELDYLLIDCPPGTGDVHITLAQLAPLSGVVLVTTPQEVALLDVRKAVSMYRTLDVPLLGVIETMSGFVCPSCSDLHRIFGEGGGRRLAEEYDIPLLAEVPLDPAVMAGGERARPVVVEAPDVPASQAYLAAAGAVAARLSVLHASRGDALDTFELTWRTDVEA